MKISGVSELNMKIRDSFLKHSKSQEDGWAPLKTNSFEMTPSAKNLNIIQNEINFDKIPVK